jgi:hypothetical protein
MKEKDALLLMDRLWALLPLAPALGILGVAAASHFWGLRGAAWTTVLASSVLVTAIMSAAGWPHSRLVIGATGASLACVLATAVLLIPPDWSTGVTPSRGGPEYGQPLSLAGSDLRGADLRHAVLRGADLRFADLRRADLTGVDLRDACLRRAKLAGAILKDAMLDGADLSDSDIESQIPDTHPSEEVCQ